MNPYSPTLIYFYNIFLSGNDWFEWPRKTSLHYGIQARERFSLHQKLPSHSAPSCTSKWSREKDGGELESPLYFFCCICLCVSVCVCYILCTLWGCVADRVRGSPQQYLWWETRKKKKKEKKIITPRLIYACVSVLNIYMNCAIPKLKRLRFGLGGKP
jgi:hypothetical protein